MTRDPNFGGRRPRGASGSSASSGRRKSARYLLPRHISEIDRLDLQHYAFRAALDE